MRVATGEKVVYRETVHIHRNISFLCEVLS